MFMLASRPSRSSQARRPLFRRAFLLALIPAVFLAAKIAQSEVVQVPTTSGEDWSITITPASYIVAVAASAPATPEIPAPPLAVTTTEVAQAEAPQTEAPAAEATPAEAPPAEVPQPEPAVQGEVVPQAEPPASTTEHGVEIVPNPTGVPQVRAYKAIYDAIPFNRTEYLANPSYRHETAMELLTGNQRQIVVHRNYTPQLNQASPRFPLFLYNQYYGYRSPGFGGPYFPYAFGYGAYGVPGYPPSFRYFLPLEDLY